MNIKKNEVGPENGRKEWIDNYGVKDFLTKLNDPANGPRLDEILSNGNENVKDLFLGTIEKVKEYHYF